MQRIFEAFLDRLTECVDETDLREAMAVTARMLELGAYAYLALSIERKSQPKLISNYPANWAAHYLKNGYDGIDPVIERAAADQEPFHWGGEFAFDGMSKHQQKVLDEAAEFGIRQGLTVPVHDGRGNIAAVTFAADERISAFTRIAGKYEQGLQLIATCFHMEVRKRIGNGTTVDGIRLTMREFECLQWAARGKSFRDIGDILGVSRRTVVYHIENAKRKLGVRTITQAVLRMTEFRTRRQ